MKLVNSNNFPIMSLELAWKGPEIGLVIEGFIGLPQMRFVVANVSRAGYIEALRSASLAAVERLQGNDLESQKENMLLMGQALSFYPTSKELKDGLDRRDQKGHPLVTMNEVGEALKVLQIAQEQLEEVRGKKLCVPYPLS